MNTSKYFLSLLLIAAPFFPMLKSANTGIIKGSITPPNGAEHVLAIAGTDTSETNINLGNFQFNDLKIGNYTVIIAAHAPYKNYVKSDVVVSDGSLTDLGQITLEQ